MMNYYVNFYNDIFRKSKGFVPLWPLKAEAELGDLFLIQTGHMIRIGNIFDSFFGVFEDACIEEDWHPSWDSWNISLGMRHSFKANGYLRESDLLCDPCSKEGLLLEFDMPGSYYFQTSKIWKRSIENFYQFHSRLLQELTSEKFSFKEVFVISSIAKVDTFSLLIAAAKKSYALIAPPENSYPPNLFDELDSRELKGEIKDMKSIATARLNQKGGQLFFKAQKLEASPRGRETVQKYIKDSLPASLRNNAENILQFSPTQVLPSVDIFPANVHELFHFREMSLNDVSTFFGG